MKKLIFLFSFTLFIATVHAQTTTVLISQQGTVTGCSSDFYDSGDASGAYGPNENFTITFHSSSAANDHIKMTFNNFDVDAGDTLIVYDGSTTAAAVLGKYNNNNLPPNFVDASVYGNGDLTFKFKSNGTLQNAGWFCSSVCIPLCQNIIAALDSLETIPHPNDSNYVDICIGTPIRFAALGSGVGVFPQNNVQYAQDSSTSLFIWTFGDGTSDTGRVVYHTYTMVRGYDVGLSIMDVRGCFNQNALGARVRISRNPVTEVHTIPDLCSSLDTTFMTLGYLANSVVVVAPITSHQSASERYDSITFIPDGPACAPGTYNTYVTFNQFLPGQTITSSNDILSVCVDIEHSFAGDLGFSIICPNGQSIILDGNDHSGGAALGVAYEPDGTNPCNPADNIQGVGWVYGWSQIYAQQGSLNTLDASVSFPTAIPPADTINQTGYFTPDQSFSGLIGCPLNGTWNIQITDNWGSDNGYVFWWELNLDASLLQTGWTYQVPIDTIIWGGSFLHVINDTTVMMIPTASGTFPVTVSVIDAFGCSYDTTLQVHVVQTPDPNLGHDTILCGYNVHYILDAGPGTTYNWSTGDTTHSQLVNTTGIYWVNVLNYNADTSLTCMGRDTVMVRVLNLPTVDLGPDQCNTGPVTLDAGNPFGFHFNWSTGDTTQTTSAPVTGMYSVTVAEMWGYNCALTDSVHINMFPEPTIDIGLDTSMCSYAKIHMRVTDADHYLDNPQYHYTYAWTPYLQTTRDIDETCLPADKTVNFGVQVTGCTTVSDTRNIDVKNCSLELPNVITPNGDAFNQKLTITGIENFPGSTLQVFNRWGKKVFESKDYNNSNNAWDGGNEADGVYYYVLTVNYGDHGECVDARNFNGTVTILR